VKWTEEWFEVECIDKNQILELENSREQRISLKFYSKLWTNIESNIIEGESCFQVLNRHGDLQYEMKDLLKSENILNKEGSLKNKIIQV